MIDHKLNGYLANPFEVDDLMDGIKWILHDSERRKSLQQEARKKVMENYTTEIIIEKYRKLYESLVNQ